MQEMGGSAMTRLEKEKLTLYASAIVNVAAREKPQLTSPEAVQAAEDVAKKLIGIANLLIKHIKFLDRR